LSRILKGYPEASIASFDFRSIEGDVAAVSGVSSVPAASPSSKAPAPPEDVESLIQKRLMDAERRALEIEKEGYDKGYEQGVKDGMEFGRKSMLIAQEHLQRVVSRLEALPSRIIEDYREWFVQTVLAAVRHMVRKELDAHPEILLQTLESLLHELGEDSPVTIFLHPKDVGLVEKALEDGEAGFSPARSRICKPDPGLERGDCRIETPLQLLDSTLDTRLALLEKALTGADEAQTQRADQDDPSES